MAHAGAWFNPTAAASAAQPPPMPLLNQGNINNYLQHIQQNLYPCAMPLFDRYAPLLPNYLAAIAHNIAATQQQQAANAQQYAPAMLSKPDYFPETVEAGKSAKDEVPDDLRR